MGRKRKHNESDVIRLIVEMKLNKIKRTKLRSLIGPVTLEEVGKNLGYTKERIRQIYSSNKDQIDAQVKEQESEIKI